MDQSRLLIIIDENKAVRQALVSRLQQTGELDVVGSTGSSKEGLLQVEALHPNIVLLETKRSDGTGLEICRRIAHDHPETTVIVLTSYDDEEERQAAYMAGAKRYILKDIDSAQLVREILHAHMSSCNNSVALPHKSAAREEKPSKQPSGVPLRDASQGSASVEQARP